MLYLENKSVREAYDILQHSSESNKINKKTVYRYFQIFDQISMEFYQYKLNTTFFEGEIELDETLLFKEKKLLLYTEGINWVKFGFWVFEEEIATNF